MLIVAKAASTSGSLLAPTNCKVLANRAAGSRFYVCDLRVIVGAFRI